MAGKISFHFDDGYISHYETVFPIFREFGLTGCLALTAKERGMGFERAREMQSEGWEILCHSATHPKMNEPLPRQVAERELSESKRVLEREGFKIRQFVTPYSVLHPSLIPFAASVYDAAFTMDTDSGTAPIETLVLSRPVNRFALHRVSLSGKTAEMLKAYVDYVAGQDAWLVFCERDIGQGTSITAPMLRDLLSYIRDKQVAVVTSSAALDSEKSRTRILSEGWDGHECFVHARIASDGNRRLLITTQMLDTDGSDAFDVLHTNVSTDGGKTWTGYRADTAFAPTVEHGVRSVCCDMTPLYHKKTGKFIVTGHIAQYYEGTIRLVDRTDYRRVTPYAVFDEETGQFGPWRAVRMPDPKKYLDCGSGCSQCYEEEDGALLIPVSYRELVNGKKQNAKAAVMRCSFDGENIAVLEIGNEIEVPHEVRGIGECSVIRSGGRYFLTIRGDTHGYVSVGDDGIHFSEPTVWRWEDGETVPTYNTQSHFFTCRDKLYLVYTRKNGHNDHVFRHRAPLYAAEVNRDTVRLKRETEFIVVPERGARLGNFGACQSKEGEALIIASEWMQPKGCEAYGSDNAVWLTDVHL